MTFHTVGAVAEAMGVGERKILDWIATGELVAIDASSRRATRPRWRITQADLDRFLAMRRSSDPMPANKTRRSTLPVPSRSYV